MEKEFDSLVTKNRSYRRFYHGEKMEPVQVRSLIELATKVPSAGNLQLLRYKAVTNEQECETVYHTLGWAGYLKEWDGPEANERPSAYIIIFKDAEKCGDQDIDVGIAAQTILLGAVSLGFGGCMLANVKRNDLKNALNINTDKYETALVIALGKPKEHVVLTQVGPDGDIRYYRDPEGTHYVPKRSVEEIMI